MAERKTIAEWERYPYNLGSLESQPEWEQYQSRLSEAAPHLFVKDGDITAIEAIIPNESRIRLIDSATALDEYLSMEVAQKAQVLLIHRAHSWSPLKITEDMLLKLFTFYRVHPIFLNVLLNFGARIRSLDGRLSPMKSSVVRNRGWTFCYSLHYTQKHHRALRDPWSIRQTGFYQAYDVSREIHTWVFLQPSIEVQNDMKRLMNPSSQSTEDAIESHILFASRACINWSHYIEFLEEFYMDSRNKALMSSVGMKSQVNGDYDYAVTFRDSQELQAFQEKLGRVLSALQYNSQVMLSLHKKLRIVLSPGWQQTSNLVAAHERSWLSRLGDIREETTKCQRNITALTKRVHGIEILLYRIHDFRNIQIAHDLTKDLRHLTELQRSEGEKTMNLIDRTARDATTVKIITSVTFLFLPGTFVATFFGMGYMQWVESDTPSSSFQVARELWIYAVVALPLTAVTICVCLWWDYKAQARVKHGHGP